MRFATLLLALPFLSLASAQAHQLECDDDNLTTYLLALIDTLYANGLTHFEELIAKVSESDTGYDLLESWHSNDVLTLFVPTDQAFQQAGLVPPFATATEEDLRDIVALHAVKDKWSWDAIPDGSKGIGQTQLPLGDRTGATANSTARQVQVMQRGENGVIDVRMPSGNATTWGWTIDTASTPIWNINLMPVDTVLPFPPKLSTALTMATTSRSIQGMPEFARALDSIGGAQSLENLTDNGFTIFAPVDDAFTPDMKSAMNRSNDSGVILGNHFAMNYTLFSPEWTSGQPYSLIAASGKELVLSREDDGQYVVMDTVKAKILRADIALENGVLHLIDRVLTPLDEGANATITAGPSGSSGAPATDSTTTDGTAETTVIEVQGSMSGAERILSQAGLVPLVLCWVLGAAV